MLLIVLVPTTGVLIRGVTVDVSLVDILVVLLVVDAVTSCPDVVVTV